MWRLLYSKRKISTSERQQLQQALYNVTYTCGTQMQALELGKPLTEVNARDILCKEPMEKLYYSVGKYSIHLYAFTMLLKMVCKKRRVVTNSVIIVWTKNP